MGWKQQVKGLWKVKGSPVVFFFLDLSLTWITENVHRDMASEEKRNKKTPQKTYRSLNYVKKKKKKKKKRSENATIKQEVSGDSKTDLLYWLPNDTSFLPSQITSLLPPSLIGSLFIYVPIHSFSQSFIYLFIYLFLPSSFSPFVYLIFPCTTNSYCLTFVPFLASALSCSDLTEGLCIHITLVSPPPPPPSLFLSL